MDIIGYIFTTIGGIFLLLGGLGIYRMPDVLNQAQAGTKASTLGIVSILIGLIFLKPDWGFKLFIIIIFFLSTSPLASHAVARAALKRNKEDFKLSQNDLSNGGNE